MFDQFHAHLVKRITLSDEEFSRAVTFFVPKKIRKRQFLLQAGDDGKAMAYVVKGCMRCYSVDDNGTEHVVQFAPEDWWISDIDSFLSGEPAQYNVDALEDSELLLLDRQRRAELFEAVPQFERLFRILIERHYVSMRKRINASLSASAEERYLSFLKTYSDLSQRVPQHQIASYLGVTPEALSRIRKHIIQR